MTTNAVLTTDADGSVYLWTDTPIWSEEEQEFLAPTDSDVKQAGIVYSGSITYLEKYDKNLNYPKPKEMKRVMINIEIL